jgi:hypothetical protein
MGNANQDTRKAISMGANNLREKIEELLEKPQSKFLVTRADLNAANYYLRTLVDLLKTEAEEGSQGG